MGVTTLALCWVMTNRLTTHQWLCRLSCLTSLVYCESQKVWETNGFHLDKQHFVTCSHFIYTVPGMVTMNEYLPVSIWQLPIRWTVSWESPFFWLKNSAASARALEKQPDDLSNKQTDGMFQKDVMSPTNSWWVITNVHSTFHMSGRNNSDETWIQSNRSHTNTQRHQKREARKATASQKSWCGVAPNITLIRH